MIRIAWGFHVVAFVAFAFYALGDLDWGLTIAVAGLGSAQAIQLGLLK